MKTDKRAIASASVAGTLYIEESLLWLLDRAIDVALAYKDAITLVINSI